MKIFCLGLSKTGTRSVIQALEILGYRGLHCPWDPATMQQIVDGDFAFRFLKEVDAVADTPVVRYYPQLDRLYPGSKFILTVREMESWLDSCARHWKHYDPDARNLAPLEIIDLVVYGCSRFNRERFRFVYEQHVWEVQRYFARRPDDLLVYDLTGGGGWGPLCRFLRHPEPAEAFPAIR
jgi:Sulfotransferase domain